MARSTMQMRMLDAMRPAALAGEPTRWQQQKSAQTRTRLLEAAVDCLVAGGYSRLATAHVAERAGVSRGAMHHHFATRMDLVAALVEYLFYQRVRLFLDDYLGELARRGESLLIEIATEAHWRTVQTREFAAYLQLAVAAHSDPELNAVFEPASRRYDEVWISEMIEAFPQWREQWEAMKLGNDFVVAAHMGMLVRAPLLKAERVAQIQQLIVRTLQHLYRS